MCHAVLAVCCGHLQRLYVHPNTTRCTLRHTKGKYYVEVVLFIHCLKHTQCLALYASKSLQSIKEESLTLITYPQNVRKTMENDTGHKVLKSKFELLGVFIMTRKLFLRLNIISSYYLFDASGATLLFPPDWFELTIIRIQLVRIEYIVFFNANIKDH